MLFDRRRSALALSTLVLILLLALPASATVMVEIPMEDLIATSDVIVHAHVLRTGSQLETYEGHLEPHTITELRIDDWLKGDGEERIAIDEIGGEVDGRGSWIDGTPRYRDGEEVVVFLGRLPGGAFRTVGMEQGRFDVVVTASGAGITTLVERDTSTIAFASWVNGRMQVHDGGPSPSVEYATFVGFVASVLEQLALPSDPRTTGGAR